MVPSFIYAKAEATYGVDIVPTAANAILAENVKYKPLGQRVAPDFAKPGVGRASGQIYEQFGELTFDVPLSASGVAGTAPKWAPLVLSCGMFETLVAVTSATYARLVSPAAAPSASIYFRYNRRSHKLLGARGTVGLKMTAGQRPVLSFRFVGLYVQVTTGALPVQADATWTGWNDSKPVAQGRTTFSFGGTNLALRDLSITAVDNLVMDDLPHQELVQLLGMAGWTGSLKFTNPLPSTFNIETQWDTAAIVVGAVVHESTAGAIVTVNFRTQVDAPDYGEEKGQDVVTVPLSLQPSALATDDEFSIVLT